MISNCASCGPTSYANPVTGIVTRKNEATQVQEIAAVRPNGTPPQDDKPYGPNVSVSAAAVSAILSVDAAPASPARLAAYR